MTRGEYKCAGSVVRDWSGGTRNVVVGDFFGEEVGEGFIEPLSSVCVNGRFRTDMFGLIG